MLAGIAHVVTYLSLKAHYDGVVIARLPFAPPGLVQLLSHRSLAGSDPRDCSMIFFYALCALCIKPNLQKALGHAPPKTAIPLGAQRLAERWTGVKTQ
jgi:hypothetical protein